MPHNALWHHWLMPIRCHFRDCKALLVTSLTHVSGAIASVLTPDLYLYLYKVATVHFQAGGFHGRGVAATAACMNFTGGIVY